MPEIRQIRNAADVMAARERFAQEMQERLLNMRAPEGMNIRDVRRDALERNDQNGGESFFALRTRPQMISTIGIEQETTSLTKETLSYLVAGLPFGYGDLAKVVRDASVEMLVYPVSISERRRVYVSTHTDEAKEIFARTNHTNTSGCELVTEPLLYETADSMLRLILPRMESNGDFFSTRCSTHVHVGMNLNLPYLKSAVALALFMEPLFYALSTSGEHPFRGAKNHAIYARPMESGPGFADRENGGYYQIGNVEEALSSKTLEAFWHCFGISVDNQAPKYVPARYFGVNIYSTLLHGTYEFRHLNQTFNAEKVLAFVKMAQIFSELTVKISSRIIDGFGRNSVFDKYTPEGLHRILESFISLSEQANTENRLSSSQIETTLQTIYSGVPWEFPPEVPMVHLRDWTPYNGMVEKGKLKRLKSRPVPAGNIDIHNIGEISLIGE